MSTADGHDGAPSAISNDDQRPSGVTAARVIVAALTVAGMAAVTRAHWSDPAVAVALAVLVGIAGWLAIIDFEIRRLPNKIVGPLAAVVTAVVVLAGLLSEDPGRSAKAVLLGLAALGFFLIGNLIGGMGMGDVKYAYPIGTTLGWYGAQPLISAALVTVVAGGLAAVFVLASGKGRRYRLAYGPFMSLGLVAGLLVAATPSL